MVGTSLNAPVFQQQLKIEPMWWRGKYCFTDLAKELLASKEKKLDD